MVGLGQLSNETHPISQRQHSLVDRVHFLFETIRIIVDSTVTKYNDLTYPGGILAGARFVRCSQQLSLRSA